MMLQCAPGGEGQSLNQQSVRALCRKCVDTPYVRVDSVYVEGQQDCLACQWGQGQVGEQR